MEESMMFKQLALDPQTPSTTTQQNSSVDLLTATIMQQQQKKLEELEKKFNSKNFLGDKSQIFDKLHGRRLQRTIVTKPAQQRRFQLREVERPEPQTLQQQYQSSQPSTLNQR